MPRTSHHPTRAGERGEAARETGVPHDEFGSRAAPHYGAPLRYAVAVCAMSTACIQAMYVSG